MPTNKEEREKGLATLQSTFSPFMVIYFFIPKIKKGGQAQWQNLNPLTNSELILASG